MDGEIRTVDPAEFFGAGVDVDERYLRAWNVEQRVTLRRQFTEPAADQDDEVGTLDPLD
jgi:hypothetical protein